MDNSDQPQRTSCSDSKKLIYGVIEFSRNGTIYVSSCPLSWLNLKDNTCSWPPKKGIERKAIMNCMTPEKDWLLFSDVTLLGKYESYKEALNYEKKRTATSSEESDDNTTTNTKRKIKKNTKYRDDSISPPPQHSNSSEEDPVDVSIESEPNDVTLSEEIFNDINMINDAEITIVNDGGYTEVLKLLNHMKVTQDIIADRLTHIEQMIASTGAGIRSHPKDSLLPKFPLYSVVELNEFDGQLKNDEAVQECLLNYLQFIGGNCAKSCVYRCLEKMFSNYLGQFCSWTGKGGNVQLNDFKIMYVIKKAVKVSFSDLTDHMYESIVKAWFNHAKTRFSREKH